MGEPGENDSRNKKQINVMKEEGLALEIGRRDMTPHEKCETIVEFLSKFFCSWLVGRNCHS